MTSPLKSTPDQPREYVLTLSCPDVPGIVAAVATRLAGSGFTILQSQQYDDLETDTFFMRVHCRALSSSAASLVDLRELLRPVADRFRMTWQLVDAAYRPRVLIMVSRFGHCLNDLMFRQSVGGLSMEVVAVVSNHPDLGTLAERYGVDFHHVPVSAATKQEAEQQLLDLVRELRVDLVVLARYMQVLSDDLCKQLDGRAINIHHSMLPSFAGARPYHQAHARGVKLVGATAHYVTGDLDEGPIIEQEVARVDHSMSPAELVAAGRDVECQALARAVRWHTENRVLVHGRRTVVLH